MRERADISHAGGDEGEKVMFDGESWADRKGGDSGHHGQLL